MDLAKLEKVWDEFLDFMDRTFQWLKYIFTGGEGGWPPVDYPDIDETTKA